MRQFNIQQMLFCSHCNKPTLHLATAHQCNHLLHGSLSLFSGGLWLPIWLCAGASQSETDPACMVCGSTIKRDRSFLTPSEKQFFAATFGVAVGVVAWLCRTRLGLILLIIGACWFTWVKATPRPVRPFAPNAPEIQVLAAPSPPTATPPRAELVKPPRAKLVRLPKPEVQTNEAQRNKEQTRQSDWRS